MTENKSLTPYQAVKNTLQTYEAEFAALLPKGMTPARLQQIYLTEIKGNPKLLACTPKSLLDCIIETARLGLDPGGALGLSYFVPYGNTAKFQLGYQGVCELIYRTGRVGGIVAKEVYDDDNFDYAYGSNQSLTHVPGDRREKDKLTHFYAYATVDRTYFTFDVMTLEEVERIQARARSKSGPWVTDFVEMGKKTVLKRYSKLLPKSVETAALISEDNIKEFGLAEVPKIDVGEPEDESWKTEALEAEEMEARQDD